MIVKLEMVIGSPQRGPNAIVAVLLFRYTEMKKVNNGLTCVSTTFQYVEINVIGLGIDFMLVYRSEYIHENVGITRSLVSHFFRGPL